MSVWRRISLNTWKTPDNATIYGHLEIDAERLLFFLKKRSEESGAKCTITHAVTRALSMTLKKHPDCNVLVRRRKIWLRRDVDVFHQVAMPVEGQEGKSDKADLSGAVVRRADTKKVEEIARELRDKALAVRERRDGQMAKTRGMLFSLPGFLLKLMLGLVGWLSYALNLRLPTTPRDPFGSAMVSTVGMLGIKMAYVPLVTFTHCPIIVLVGQVEDRPVARDGQVIVRPICILTATLDHRVLDGFQGARLADDVKRLLENPELLDRDPQSADA